jgi:arginase family enzyme
LTEREGGDLANRARGITIFAVPYDSGHRALRMGAGPEHLLSNGMEGVLAATGREVRSEILEVTSPFRAEIATAFELFGMLAKRVHETTAKGSFPLVLSGNCNATVGVIAGLAGASPKRRSDSSGLTATRTSTPRRRLRAVSCTAWGSQLP